MLHGTWSSGSVLENHFSPGTQFSPEKRLPIVLISLVVGCGYGCSHVPASKRNKSPLETRIKPTFSGDLYYICILKHGNGSSPALTSHLP